MLPKVGGLIHFGPAFGSRHLTGLGRFRVQLANPRFSPGEEALNVRSVPQNDVEPASDSQQDRGSGLIVN